LPSGSAKRANVIPPGTSTGGMVGERFGFEHGRTLADFLAAVDRLGAGT
jgi:hypothetical protein